MAAALEGLSVVDVAGTVATSYCAKLFNDYGARVVNLEPDKGFETRLLPPLVPDVTAAEASAMHAWLHAGKLSVQRSALGANELNKLIESADLILDNGENANLIAANPNVRAIISWFGAGKAYADHSGSDGLCFALNGMLRTIGRIEGPPLIPTGYQAQIVGGNTAFIGAMGEVLAGELGNRQSAVDLETSILEATMCFTEVGTIGSYNTDIHAERMGINRYPPTYPMGVYPCKDGWLGVTALTPSQWHSFCDLLGMQEFARVPLFQSAIGRLEAADVFEPLIREKLLEFNAEELFYRGQKNAVPLARVPTMEELFAVDQFVDRNAFSTLELAGEKHLQAPGIPFRLFATPPAPGGRVAPLGADTLKVSKLL